MWDPPPGVKATICSFPRAEQPPKVCTIWRDRDPRFLRSWWDHSSYNADRKKKQVLNKVSLWSSSVIPLLLLWPNWGFLSSKHQPCWVHLPSPFRYHRLSFVTSKVLISIRDNYEASDIWVSLNKQASMQHIKNSCVSLFVHLCLCMFFCCVVQSCKDLISFGELVVCCCQLTWVLYWQPDCY